MVKKEFIKREYTVKGVKKWYKTKFGGNIACTSYLTEWGEKTDIKPCSTCNGMHDRYNPPQCFSCAMGLN